MKTIVLASTVAIFCTTPTFAKGEVELRDSASMLGTILASEDACKISISEKGIDNFIINHVRADDMQFAENLNSNVALTASKIGQMSRFHKRAHCVQVLRSGTAHGLILR